MAKDYLIGIQKEQSNLDFTRDKASEVTVTFSMITKDKKYETVIDSHSDFINELAELCRRISKEFYDDDLPIRLEGSD